MCSNIKKRVFFVEFFNKIKYYKTKEYKNKLAVQKVFKIIKTNVKFNLEISVRKMENYTQFNSLEKKLVEKKERISKIYDLNAERTVILQKEREVLRNLKYKLDH